VFLNIVALIVALQLLALSVLIAQVNAADGSSRAELDLQADNAKEHRPRFDL